MSATPATALAQAVGLEDELRAAGLADLLPLLDPLVQELNRRCGLLFAVDPGDTSSAAFETFWGIWCGAGLPRTGKAGARAAWKAKRRELPPLADLLAAARAYAASPRVRGGTVRNPETWLRKGCWSDDASTLTAIGQNGRDLAPADLPQSIRDRWPLMDRHERELVMENRAMGLYRATTPYDDYDGVTEGDW